MRSASASTSARHYPRTTRVPGIVSVISVPLSLAGSRLSEHALTAASERVSVSPMLDWLGRRSVPFWCRGWFPFLDLRPGGGIGVRLAGSLLDCSWLLRKMR